MKIVRSSDIVAEPGNAEYFTGTVRVESLATEAAGRVRVARVFFAVGARTAWHTHPHGQLLHILSGVGLVQREGGGISEVKTGDTIWFEPGERHWHGATPMRSMTHLAVQQADESGSAVRWLEHVTGAEYAGGKGSTPAPAAPSASLVAEPPAEGPPVLTDEEKAAGFEIRELEHFADLPEWERTVKLQLPRFAATSPEKFFRVSVLRILGDSDAIFRVRHEGRRAYAHLRWGCGSAWSYATFYGSPAWHPVSGDPIYSVPKDAAGPYLKAENPGITIQPVKFTSRPWAGG